MSIFPSATLLIIYTVLEFLTKKKTKNVRLVFDFALCTNHIFLRCCVICSFFNCEQENNNRRYVLYTYTRLRLYGGLFFFVFALPHYEFVLIFLDNRISISGTVTIFPSTIFKQNIVLLFTKKDSIKH